VNVYQEKLSRIFNLQDSRLNQPQKGFLSRHKLDFELAPHRISVSAQCGDGGRMVFAAPTSLNPGHGRRFCPHADGDFRLGKTGALAGLEHRVEKIPPPRYCTHP
jgi:hypothetical protein